jgi:hypothetical protein
MVTKLRRTPEVQTVLGIAAQIGTTLFISRLFRTLSLFV